MKALIYFVIAALVLLGLVLWRTLDAIPSNQAKINVPVKAATPASGTSSAVAPTPSNQNDVEESTTIGSPLTAQLNAPAGNAQQDVDTLHELLLQYLHNMRHPNAPPIGGDSDLVLALTGHNPLNFVVIPSNHPAISQDGRLRDRWGTPYFIHPTGGNAFEIRSAGPDKKLFTPDDVIAKP